MSSNINKKKISLFSNQKLLKYSFITILLFSIFIFIYYELIKGDKIYTIIEDLSVKYDYQLKIVEINTLKKIDRFEVDSILQKYYGQSIFLLPLEKISNSINELIWVKDVNLSTNFTNKLNIEIFEYKPVGLFAYNNQLFYFSKNGTIIDKFREEIDESLIIFNGKQALKEAYNFLSIINKVEIFGIIKEAYYVNERRWDVKLQNDILLKLSEKNIDESILNYIKLIKKFNNSDIDTIKSIDLRNSEKVIISSK